MKSCRYCSEPIRNARQVQCGSAGCKRKFNAERAREPMAKYRKRKIAELGPRLCKGCGIEFDRFGKRLYCSPICKRRTESRAEARSLGRTPRRRFLLQQVAETAARGSSSTRVWINGTCAECGEMFTRTGRVSGYCSKACSSRERRRTRRALMRGLKVSPVRRFRIHERDNWTCHICGDPVNREARVPELDAPTLDHVIALAAGGPHSESNLRTAHFYCNSVKRELALSEVA